MAGHNVILDAVKEDPNDGFRDIIKALRMLEAGDREYNTVLQTLERKIPSDPRGQRPATQFAFRPALITLADWLQQLRRRGITPIVNNHFRESKDCAFGNSAEESYLVDEVRAGHEARDTLAAENAEATAAELQQEFENGAREARRANSEAARRDQTWFVLRREAGNDVRMEDSLIRYLSGKKDPDWYATIQNISDFGIRNGYDVHHYKTVLDRFVSFFAPALRAVTQSMDADTMARFLSNLTMPDSEFDMIEGQIRQLARNPGEKIRTVMSHLLALAQTLYKKYSPDQKAPLVEKLMVTGLLNFTTGQTRLELQSALENCRRDNRTVSWEKLLEGVTRSESIHGLPLTPLGIATPMQQQIMTFNVNTRPRTGLGTVGQPVNTGLDYSWNQSTGFDSMFQMPSYTSPPPQPAVQAMLRQQHDQGQNHPDPAVDNQQIFGNPENPGLPQPGQAVDAVNGAAAAAPQPAAQQPRATAGNRPGLRSGSRQINPPDHEEQTVHQSDFVEVLAAKIVEMTDKGRQSRKDKSAKAKAKDASKDKSKDVSKDRSKAKRKAPQKTGAKPKIQAYQSRSQSRETDQSRSQSRDTGRSRSQSQDRGRFRSESQDRGRTRPQSTGTEGSRSRSQSRDPRPRPQSRDRQQSRKKDEKKGQTTPSKDKRFDLRPRRAKSWSSKDMERGLNCHKDYDPSKEKRCLKCMTEGKHHEFACERYFRRSRFNCKTCSKGFHWPDECDQEPRNRSRSRDNRPRPDQGNN